MNPQTNKAKDFFLNLGATISLYTVVGSLINLLFTVINYAYPKITASYATSSSISFPVATLVIFTPILVLLMWTLGKQYTVESASAIHKWLTYITLFIAGLLIAGDLITVLYYFIDGQELSLGFILKALVLLVVSAGIFGYYLTDIRGKLTPSSRKIWRIASIVFVIGSIVLGFAVLGSPRTQRLYKYDEQKINDLMTINQDVISYFQSKGSLPNSLSDLTSANNYYVPTDAQSNQPYEYVLVGQSAKAYQLCAEFNKASQDVTSPNVYARPIGYTTWNHPAGHYCFNESIDVSLYPKLPM